jgi:hypothetical protein
MQTTTPTRRRTLRLARTEAGSLALTIAETKSGRQQIDVYYLSRTEKGWRFSKHDCAVYEVTPKTCNCKGFTFHRHCKHTEALRKLESLGKLPASECSVCHGAGGSQAGDVDADSTCRGCGQ